MDQLSTRFSDLNLQERDNDKVNKDTILENNPFNKCADKESFCWRCSKYVPQKQSQRLKEISKRLSFRNEDNHSSKSD